MGLFSFFNKNKQDGADDDGAYVSRDDDDAIAAKARSKRASSANEPAARRTGRSAPDPVLPEKKRARRRLVGAVALALGVAVGLPMILDSEPRPVTTDIDIRIPSKEKAAPQAMPAMVQAADSLDKREEIVEPAKEPVEIAREPVVAEIRVAEPKSEVKPDLKPAPVRLEPKVADKPLVKAEQKPAEPKPEPKPAEPKPVAKPDTARAMAILEDKPVAAAAPQKYVVQVAALQSQEKVDELQGKLKAAGIASFTQKSGEWIRIRVGPFSKDEGEQIRAKLSKLGFSSTMVAN